MDKSNLELFKRAISEGLSARFDSIVNSCTEEIVCSERHKLAMRTIVYGKIDTKRTLSPKMKRIIAILVATALLLTSCAVIFRNEIREIFEDFFVMITCKEDRSPGNKIENIYRLSYVPEGYSLEKETLTPVCVQYKYKISEDKYLLFEQRPLDGSDFYVDNEEGYSRVSEITDYEIYYRYTNENHVYVWNDSKHSMCIKSTVKLSASEILSILNGITTK